MTEAGFGEAAANVLATEYTRHYYPVLGVVNGPTSDKSPLTAYGRQVARSIMRYFRGETAGPSGWDSGGAGRVPRWQTESFERVDDIPRRKGVQQKQADNSSLSPRSKQGELWGEGLLSPRWVVDKQQRRPAAVMSLHTLEEGNDVALGDEMARNRVCVAAYGLSYAAVVIVSRAQADEPQAEARLGALQQRSGLEPTQFFVCRPSAQAPQQQAFHAFLGDLERRLYARACAFYAAAFMRTQAKLVALPQLPLPPSPASPGALGDDPRVFRDPGLVSRFSRFLPLRAWLVRYHFKLAVFAECGGDRDTAQRCMWLAYAHLLAYVGEIAAGAYLPAGSDDDDDDGGPDRGLAAGWLWALNGGDADGSRARSLRMFGPRWDEAMQLLDAVHVRVVRGWLYQALDAAALRSSADTQQQQHQQQGQQLRPPPITPVSRSGPRAAATPTTSPLSASFSEPMTSSAGGNGSLEALIFSVHAGECSAATEQLMDAERSRQQQLGASDAMYFLALGSETADVDLLQPVASDTCGWWPLGGHYAVVDFSASSSGSRLRPTGFDGASRLGLVLNSSLDVGAAASLLPQTNHYDAHLTLAARQCVQHVAALALVLGRAGFGDASSSYFWAAVARQYSAHAALFVTAAANGVDFGGAFDAASVDVSPLLPPSVVVDSVVATLRRPLGTTVKSSAASATPPAFGGGSRPVVRGRALSTAFTGFAFDEALGGIYAVVGPKEKQRASESAGAGVGGGGGGTLCPLWMWPRTAAPLFQAASFATLQRHRRLAAEDTAYSTHSADARVFSANPGVENTYAGVWLAAERKRHAEEPGATLAATTRLLSAAALACLHQPPGATDGELLGVDALVGAISGDSSSAQFLCLASELAEVHAESGSFATALPIFQALVRRFRSEGWEALGRHALQWVGRCAAAVDDRRVALTAGVELLSQADGVSDIDALLDDAEPMVLDMTQMYAPITCHAHWRHWRLKGAQMAFQVELNCRALARPLRLSELCVEFSDPRYCVRLSDDGTSEADGLLRFCDVGGERQKQCSLELKAGSTVVFEGCVEIDGDVVASRALVLAGVSATIGNVTLRWPTCAPASTSSSSSLSQTAVVTHDGEQGFSPMEALLAARAAVARARDPLLLPSHAGAGAGAGAAADDAHVAAASYSEHAALRRAVAVAGPTVPANHRWLVVVGADNGHLSWVQLASPPLVPAQLLADEPGFSAYSRCRVLALPVAAEAGGLVVVSMPRVGDSAPAYRGEAFAVEIVVRNAHARLPAVGVAVDVRLASGLGDDVADSMSNLNVASSDASESGGGAELAVEAAGDAPWLTAEDGDDGGRARELLGVLPGGSAADLAPGESRTVTVFVNFPAAQLSSASQSTATDLAVVRCTVRYSTASSESPIHVLAQASIPVARPLYATAELLPAHVAAAPTPTSAAGTGGEFCFRRPVLVTLHNAGPWDVTVDRMALHPPPAEALSQALSAAGAAPMRVAVAGATAPSATLSAGGSLQHVFWVDITTRDLVRLAGDVCPGTLHVDWRRAAGSACVARLWLPAMRLVARRLTVESLCEAPVARVGQALGLGYRLTNLTRRARTLDVAMHATEAFVFAGPRRATLTVLPGCAAVLRFCLLPLTAAAATTSVTNSVSTAFAPGFAVFQDKGNATGLGWVRLPRLEIKDRENPAMSPSSAASVVVAAAPPPTRAAPSVLVASPEASVLAAAQRTVAALAAVDDVDRPLTPGLAAQCIDVLPPALVYGASGGAESDFEDEDDEDDERPADVDDDDDEILRLDQTAIYCLPAKD